jgi:GNAT superfamily N-acetyltransferase
MPDTRLHIRRCKRTDFIEVMRLLAAGEAPAALPDRGTLRRFRAIVNDLGGDFYLALTGGAVAGLVHITYVRQLAEAPGARIERLIVGGPFRRRRIGAALLEFATQRAIRRGCGTLTCLVPSGDNAAACAMFEKAGLRPQGQLFVREL